MGPTEPLDLRDARVTTCEDVTECGLTASSSTCPVRLLCPAPGIGSGVVDFVTYAPRLRSVLWTTSHG